MRLCIPALGQPIVLLENWEFTLYPEYRNLSLWRLLEVDVNDYARRTIYVPPSERLPGESYQRVTQEERTLLFLLQKGTTLTVERVFIRKGSPTYDSVTFSYRAGKTRYRFWAKLADVNRMEIESC